MHASFCPVLSSNIDGYFYLVDRQVLLIAFKGGKTYAYEHVEPAVVAEFASAPSKGTFFHSEIRERYATSYLDDMAVANLLGGLGASGPVAYERRGPIVRLESFRPRYPLIVDALF